MNNETTYEVRVRYLDNGAEERIATYFDEETAERVADIRANKANRFEAVYYVEEVAP